MILEFVRVVFVLVRDRRMFTEEIKMQRKRRREMVYVA